MVFDFMDISSKVCLASVVEHWLEDKQNSDSIQAISSSVEGIAIKHKLVSHDYLRDTLTLIGVGMITPILQKNSGFKTTISFALRSPYALPKWVFNFNAYSKLEWHVDMILDGLNDAKVYGLIVSMLNPAIESALNDNKVASPPLMPIADPAIDKALIDGYKREVKNG